MFLASRSATTAATPAPAGAVAASRSSASPTDFTVAARAPLRGLSGTTAASIRTGANPGALPAAAAPSPSTEGPTSDAGSGPTAHRCLVDADCPARHGCLTDPATQVRSCLPAECEEDHHCFPAFACRVVTDGTTAPPVRRCIAEGVRRRGERCSVFQPTPATACAEGLVCLFFTCGPRCDPTAADAGCGPDETCVPSQQGEGAACLPSCARTGCPDGQRCLTLGALSKCAAVRGEDCTKVSCPKGRSCEVDARDEVVSFACRAGCNSALGTGCLSGELCGAGVGGASVCYAACDAGACAGGAQCLPINEDATLHGCR